MDSNNDVYAAESGGNSVNKFNGAGQLITAWISFDNLDLRSLK